MRGEEILAKLLDEFGVFVGGRKARVARVWVGEIKVKLLVELMCVGSQTPW